MAYQHQGSCASAGDTLELLAFDDEFDPLAVDDSEIDQEWMDDENPYDTIDYPTMRNMPETVHHDPVYSPARQGSASGAHCPQPQPSARAAEHHRPVRGRLPFERHFRARG